MQKSHFVSHNEGDIRATSRSVHSKFWRTPTCFVVKKRDWKVLNVTRTSSLPINTNIMMQEALQKGVSLSLCSHSELKYPVKSSEMYCKYPNVEDPVKNSVAQYMNEEAEDFNDFLLLDSVMNFFKIWKQERQARRKQKAQRRHQISVK